MENKEKLEEIMQKDSSTGIYTKKKSVAFWNQAL